jgi:hypothetical protein
MIIESDCPECHGLGFIRSAPPETAMLECPCVTRAQMMRYLTPVYKDAVWNQALDPEPYRRNILFTAYLQTFEDLVKSFLQQSFMQSQERYEHHSISGYGVAKSYLNDPQAEMGQRQLLTVDILFLYLGTDPHNSHYGSYLTSLISERNLRAKITWVFSKDALDSAAFKGMYGAPFASFLLGTDANFKVKRTGQPLPLQQVS